jgi:hypothetical protein
VPDLVLHLKNLIESEDFCNRHKNRPEDFTRKRALPFQNLIYYMINLPAAAYEAELCNLNKNLNGLDIAESLATKGALTKAREKLKHTAFIELNDHLVDLVQAQFAPNRWHGHFLLATDGTLCSIPTDKTVAEHFGQWHGRQGNPCPKARVSQIYDVLNHITVDALITSKSIGERDLAAAHSVNLSADDLLLLDRGYECFWLFKLILMTGANLCARVSCNKLKIVKAFLKSGEPEHIIKYACTPSSARKCAEFDLDKKPLRLRLVRVDLPTGETEVLITSLTDRQKYPREVFGDLYHQRWPVEEDYKVMKSRIQIENFSGKTVHSVYQDFYAKIFTKNFAAILIQSVNDRIEAITAGRLYTYKANFTNVLAMTRHHIVVLFSRMQELLWVNVSKVQKLIVRVLNEIRPGRSEPRAFKKKSRKKFSTAYKPIP